VENRRVLFYEYLHLQIPDPCELVQLSIEGLAELILDYAKSGGSGRNAVLQDCFGVFVDCPIAPFPGQYHQEIVTAVAQARSLLLNEQLVIRAPGQSEGYLALTSRGREISLQGLRNYFQSKMLNRDLLHTRIAERAWDHLRNGRYDEAIMAAFKELEVAVRAAGNFAPKDLGVDLMRRAFNPESGVLHDVGAVDLNSTRGEQHALADLFAGAIGVYKNPQSHRWVGIDEPVKAIEALMLASHLLRLLEARLDALGRPLPP
jgi:uncharacterized protein (TIGR02391 family)